MRPVLQWGILLVLCQLSVGRGHVLGRPSASSDLAQLKQVTSSIRGALLPPTVLECEPESLLQRFEETLAEAAQDEQAPEADYEGTNQDPENSQTSRGWSPEQEALIPQRSAEGRSRAAASARSRLQDLLLTSRRTSSGCFGARMDRIGNASGLGCNSSRG